MRKIVSREFAEKHTEKLLLGGSLAVVVFAYLSYPYDGNERTVDGITGVDSATMSPEDQRSQLRLEELIQKRKRDFNDAVSDCLGFKMEAMKKKTALNVESKDNSELVNGCEQKHNQCIKRVDTYSCTANSNMNDVQQLRECNEAVRKDESLIPCCFAMVEVMNSCYEELNKCLDRKP